MNFPSGTERLKLDPFGNARENLLEAESINTLLLGGMWEWCKPRAAPHHTRRTHSRDLSQLWKKKKASAVEKQERLDAPAPQTSYEEMVEVNPRLSMWTQRAHERMLAGGQLWGRVSRAPPPQGGFDLPFSVI